MNRATLLLAFVVTLTVVQSASAQIGYVRPSTNPLGTPVVSPYINLARGGNPAANYYGIVRPTEDFMDFQQQVLNQRQTTGTRDMLRSTGNSARFNAYGNYFNNVGGQRIGVPAPPPGYSSTVTNTGSAIRR